MTDDLLRDLAKELPFERPTAARRDAIRSSLLVEAAESARPDPTARRWPIAAGFAAGALAAAAIAVLVMRKPTPVIERANLAQVTASSEGVRIDHQIVATEQGSDEIVRIRQGTIALAIPAQRRGDRMIVKTTTADVEGEAGELEVTVANEQLQSVRVKSGTARIVVIGQTPVILSAGQVWRASVITADLSPSQPAVKPEHESAATTTEPTPPAAKASTSAATRTPNTTTPPTTSPSKTVTTPLAKPTPRIASSLPSSRIASSLPTASSPTKTTPAASSLPTTASSPTKTTPAAASLPTTASPSPSPSTAPTASSVPAPAVTAVESNPPIAEATPGAKVAPIEQRFQRGWALLKAGKAQQAADELGAAADASPASPLAADARYFQAVALVRANDPRAAERVLVQFLDAAPKSLRRGRAAVLLGRLLAERGDPKSARAWLETAATDPDPAIAAAAKAGLQTLKP